MKIAAAMLTGFLVGILMMVLARPAQRISAQQTKANPALHVHVSEVPRSGEIDLKGSQTVGFTCYNSFGQNSANYRCFIATAE
jgi:hypothetical protein